MQKDKQKNQQSRDAHKENRGKTASTTPPRSNGEDATKQAHRMKTQKNGGAFHK